MVGTTQKADNETNHVAFFRAFTTQSDWSGPVARETWQAKHSLWRRLLAFSLILGVLPSMETILLGFFKAVNDDSRIPILENLSSEQMASIRAAHLACAESLCDLAETIPLDCVRGADNSLSADFGRFDGPDIITLPEICRDALEETVGSVWDVNLMQVQRDGSVADASTTSTKLPGLATLDKTHKSSLLTFYPDCSVEGNAQTIFPPDNQENHTAFDNNNETIHLHPFAISLNNFFPNTTGDRKENVLTNLFCPDDMDPGTQEKIKEWYDLAMANPGGLACVFAVVVLGGMVVYNFVSTLSLVVWLMIRMIIPASVAQRVLSWPKNTSNWHIWQAMVLLGLISSQSASRVPSLSCIMAASAFLFHSDTKAAFEWTFLGVLAWGSTTVDPYLGSFATSLFLPESWGVLTWIVRSVIHLLVVGEGWWKLVTVYVFARSYRALAKSNIENTHARQEVGPSESALGSNVLDLSEQGLGKKAR